MGAIESFVNGIVGSSWRTSLLGYLKFGIMYAGMFLHDGGAIPATKEGWLMFAYGAFSAWQGRVQKDSNVSNAQVPQKEAKPVS